MYDWCIPRFFGSRLSWINAVHVVPNTHHSSVQRSLSSNSWITKVSPQNSDAKLDNQFKDSGAHQFQTSAPSSYLRCFLRLGVAIFSVIPLEKLLELKAQKPPRLKRGQVIGTWLAVRIHCPSVRQGSIEGHQNQGSVSQSVSIAHIVHP